MAAWIVSNAFELHLLVAIQYAKNTRFFPFSSIFCVSTNVHFPAIFLRLPFSPSNNNFFFTHNWYVFIYGYCLCAFSFSPVILFFFHAFAAWSGHVSPTLLPISTIISRRKVTKIFADSNARPSWRSPSHISSRLSQFNQPCKWWNKIHAILSESAAAAHWNYNADIPSIIPNATVSRPVSQPITN